MAKNPELIHIQIGDNRVLLGDFVDRVVTELKPVNFKSRLFSTKGVVDQVEMEREQRSAIDRVVQGIRDGR